MSYAKIAASYGMHAMESGWDDGIRGVWFTVEMSRYGKRGTVSISSATFEDSMLSPGRLLDESIREVAARVVARPVVDFDPGDEDWL